MKLCLMTYNIRYNTSIDAENAWPFRKQRVLELIQDTHAHIVGLQEVLAGQLAYLAEHLTDYSYIGVGRDDGKFEGEFAPIFYQKHRFELLRSGTFWLSEKPAQIASIGWDASLPRIATWAELWCKQAGQNVFVCNTHFDHLGEQARQESSGLVLKQLAKLEAGYPCFLMGDLNAEPDSLCYKILSAQFQDTFLTADRQDGGPLTYRGFQEGKEEAKRIDYIFAKKPIKPSYAATLERKYVGYYPSDHVPVLVHLDLHSR